MFAVSFIASQGLIKVSSEEEIDLAGTSETSSETTRLENTDTVTYIYDAEDLSNFRDAVNAGDNYSGKTVYLMDDIDLSTVCSSTLGSWTPIGNTSTNNFVGTFDGNSYEIKNFYINSSISNSGLFGFNYGTIKNIIISGTMSVNSNINGAIAGRSCGTIKNCDSYVTITVSGNTIGGITGYIWGTALVEECMNYGTITSGSTYTTIGGIVGEVGTSSCNINNCGNRANITGGADVGGITGRLNYGVIRNCYNIGTINGVGKNGNGDTMVGGITGYFSANSNGYIYNSYNRGTVKGTYGEVGGIVGGAYSSSTYYKRLYNCYNTGAISGGHDVGSLVGRGRYLVFNNCYWTSSQNAVGAADTAPSYTNTQKITTTVLKTYTVVLGSAYAYDVYGINSGYPVLAWQNETTVMSLNKNQAYIGVGENLALNVVEKDEVTEIIGNNYSNTNFTWTSTNEDVATVDKNGVVTGISDGYTTVYAYHEKSGLYAMCVVNVAKGIANPQIEVGNGFTSILKSDGTVWTIGNNVYGAIGNGTTENVNKAVNVQIDEDTILSNVVKITCRNISCFSINKRWKSICMGI